MTDQPVTRSGSILIWGSTKVGKTLDAHCAFSNAITLLSEPDGLSSVETSLGYTPPHIPLVDLEYPYREVMAHITQTVAPAVQNGEYGAVIVDTLSELALRLQAAYAEKVSNDPRKLYPAITDQMSRVIRSLHLLPVWFVGICHKQQPRQGEKFRRGGPKLPGELVENVPSMFSLILEATIDRGLGEPRRIYRCEPDDAMYVMGDRWGVAAKKQPMDLRPMLYRRMYPDHPVLLFESKPIRTPDVELESGTVNPIGKGETK